jgi:hypothetical protein
MKVLVACEFSGVVRDAFELRGWDAWSCDLLPSERPGNHIQGDVLSVLNDGWDLLVAHPPCTYLCSSGARWWRDRRREQGEAIRFFLNLALAGVPRICVENPVGIISRVWRKSDQIIQPWQFGHGEVKTTCLWLEGLPALKPGPVVVGREQRCWKHPENGSRWRDRSRTFEGIAAAMAEQWTE